MRAASARLVAASFSASALRVQRCGDKVGRLSALGDLSLARRNRLLLRGDSACTRSLRGRDRHGPFGGFVCDRDRAFDRGDLDLAVALQLEAADIAIACHPRFCQAPLRCNARPLDLLARTDLGLFEGLTLGDIEGVELPLAFEPCGIKRPLLSDL